MKSTTFVLFQSQQTVPVQRIDHPDLLFASIEAKFKAVVEDVKARYQKGQPVLVGTVAVETK